MKKSLVSVCLFIAAATNASAQIATVGDTRASSSSGSSQWSARLTPAAGDTLLVGCDFNTGLSFIGVTDSAGDSFSQVGSEADSAFAARAYIATNVRGGRTTVTCKVSSPAQNNEIYVTEFKGVNPVSPLGSVAAVAGPNTPAQASITTTYANEMIWGYIVSGQVTTASSWAPLSAYDGNLVTDHLQATPGTISASFPVTMGWTLILVALNPVGVGNAGGSVSPISVSASPSSTSARVNQSVSLMASLQNDIQNKGVTWLLSGSGCSGATCGSLSNITTTSVTYTAPSAVPNPAAVSLKATSIADTTKSASSVITVTAASAPISVSVSPASSSVQVATAANFTASLQNDTQNKGATWSLSGSGCSGATCGSLSNVTTSSVTYTAPASIPSPAAVALKATSIADATKSVSAAITLTPSTTPPTPPANLSASANGSSQIDLSWSASSDPIGVSAYLLERCLGAGCSDFAQISSVSATSFNDTGLTASSSYSYRVRATDASNNLSSYSNTASASTAPASSGGGSVPTLVWSKSAANSTGYTVQTYTSNLPTYGTLPGNVLLATFQFGAGSGASASVTDDKGDSLALLNTSSDGNQIVSTFCGVPSAGARVLTLTFSGGMPPYVSMVNASEWFNLTCSLDGSSSSSNSTSSISTGPFSTSSDGDLIYQAAVEDGAATSVQWLQGAAPWALLSASTGMASANVPQATQFQVQSVHGSINPTFSINSPNSWNSLAVALQPASAGTAPPAGIRILHMQEESIAPGQGGSLPLQFPCSGNLLITASNDGPDFDIASISDTNGNAHIQIGTVLNTGNAAGDIQTFYAPNAVTSTRTTITYSMTGNPTGGSTFFLYDVTGASSSPFDSTAGRQTASGTQSSAGNVAGPTITPSTANGLVITQISVYSNSINGVSPGHFLATIPNPLGQTSPLNENNGWGFEYNTTTTARQYIWTTLGGAVVAWSSTAVAFKAP